MFNSRCPNAEERGLAALQGDAPLGDVEILLVQLEADEVPMLLDAGDGGGAAAHCSVENHPPSLLYVSTR